MTATARRPTSPAPLRLDARAIGKAATLALYDELSLAPKPGLVTLVDRGSHADMDAHTFMRSLFALRSSFVRFAELGAIGAPFESLERCGIAAEARMAAATGGVNTHRGAIFTLGLLCASAGAVGSAADTFDADRLRQTRVARWGDSLERRADRPSNLPGGQAARRHGLRGASREAALGFPVFFDVALPAWTRARALTPQQRRLDTLFSVMAVLDDSNLVHRGGIAGLQFAKREAAAFLAAGGAAATDGIARARAIARAFADRRLSPGGAADMLSAACWFERLTCR